MQCTRYTAHFDPLEEGRGFFGCWDSERLSWVPSELVPAVCARLTSRGTSISTSHSSKLDESSMLLSTPRLKLLSDDSGSGRDCWVNVVSSNDLDRWLLVETRQ
ncbi:hypothetical protein MTO96_039932 [Rhipicephalus appendiculatus]